MTKPGRFPPWTRMVILCTLLLVAAYGLVALEELETRGKGPGRPTTYSTGSHGYKALYLWLRALGIPVNRWERPLGSLPPEVTVVAILQPELGPDPGELRNLEGWVRRGGTLLVSSLPSGPFLSHFGLEAASPSGEAWKPGQACKVRSQPGPYTPGEYTVVRKNPASLTSSRPEAVFHAVDALGGLVAVVKAGKGQVIAVADPWLFANQSLREGDHARMALDLLLVHLGRGVLAVDEYHHGYGRATTVMGHVAHSRTFPPLVQGAVLLLILWAARGRRFGLPRPVPRQEARSAAEYVGAMARLFQRGRKRAFALEAMIRWVDEEARRLLVDGDQAVREALRSGRRRLQETAMTDEELLREAQDLYRSLEKARGRERLE